MKLIPISFPWVNNYVDMGPLGIIPIIFRFQIPVTRRTAMNSSAISTIAASRANSLAIITTTVATGQMRGLDHVD